MRNDGRNKPQMGAGVREILNTPLQYDCSDRADVPAERLHCGVLGCSGVCAHRREDDVEVAAEQAPSPPERIWIDPAAPKQMYFAEFYEPLKEHLVEYILLSAHQREVEELREALRKLRWMASVVYLHYHNCTDLDPVQQKHLELAIRNGAPFSDAEENAAAREKLEGSK